VGCRTLACGARRRRSGVPVADRPTDTELGQMSPVTVRPAGQRGDQRRPAPSGQVDLDGVKITPRTRLVCPHGPNGARGRVIGDGSADEITGCYGLVAVTTT